MAGYDGRGAKFDIVAVTGNDLAFTVTAVDADAVAVDLSAATITATVYDKDDTALDTLTASVGGAGSNVITLSLTDTEVDALTSPTSWALVVTRSGDARTWLAGRFNVASKDRARTGTSGTSVTATVDTNVTITATATLSVNAGNVAIADSGGYYTGTTVETALAEIANGTTLAGTYAPIGVSAVSFSSLPGALNNVDKTNGVPYIQDNVTSQGGYQFAVWIDGSKNPIVGKRTLPNGAWSTFDLSTVAGNPLSAPTEADSHNSYSIGVDSSGVIHIAGNHHDDALRYVKSSTAYDITAWTAPGMVGTEEDSVTYPTFLRVGSELIFVYRNGVSGAGAMYLNAYNTGTGTWSRRSRPLSGLAGDGVSPDESPYWNHIDVDGSGVMHVWYLWRTTSDVSTNHDVYYMQSDDAGVTFAEMDGTALTLPVTPSDNTVIKSGYDEVLNQSGAAADSDGIPHACWWIYNSSAASLDLTHYYWNGSAWTSSVVLRRPYIGAQTVPRPSVFCIGDRTFVIYSSDGGRESTRWWCEEITVTNSPTARFLLLDTPLGSFEPSYDTRAIRDRDELNVLVTPCSPTTDSSVDTAYEAQWGAVMTVDLTRIDQLAATSRTLTIPETFVIPSREMENNSGSPTFEATTFGVPVWMMADSGTRVVKWTMDIPPDWNTYDVYIWWANAGATSGNVVLNYRYGNRGAGSTVNAGEVNAGNVTATAGAQYVLTRTLVASGLIRYEDRIAIGSIRRLGSDAADTLAQSIGVFRAEYMRAT